MGTTIERKAPSGMPQKLQASAGCAITVSWYRDSNCDFAAASHLRGNCV